MREREFAFQVQGVVARVWAEESHIAILDRLMGDFSAFAVADGALGPPRIEIRIGEILPPRFSKLPRLGRFSTVEVFGFWNRRKCVYPEGVSACSESVKGARRFWIDGSANEVAREVAYTFLLSAIGEELDTLNFHRVHALGFETENRRVVFMASSGVGKSSLATLLLRSARTRLFSDESPLINGLNVSAFPIRMALAPNVAQALSAGAGEIFRRYRYQPKVLLEIPRERVAKAGSVDVLLLAGRKKSVPEIRSSPRISGLPTLFLGIVVGLGLAQMAEWMLRGNALPRLVRIAFKRASTGASLLWGAGACYTFHACDNAFQNLVCLNEFLDKIQSEKHVDNSIPMPIGD